MRDELTALLRLTQQLEREAEALARAIRAEVARELRRGVALAATQQHEPWRWN